ncbi:EAL domain-containing protein [Marinobacteraceae bacterium S3BR75-40.1]
MDQNTRTRRAQRLAALRIALLYSAFSSLWVGFSDQLLLWVVGPDRPLLYSWLQTAKGILFVLLSGLLLYYLARLALRRRSRAERRLQTREMELRQMVGFSPVVSYLLHYQDATPKTLWVSENIRRLTGYTVAQAKAPGWWRKRVHPEDWAEASQGLERARRFGQYSHEYRFRHADGRYLWIRDQIRFLTDKVGRDVISGAWSDITQRHQWEERLRLQGAVIENTHNGIMVTDLAGRILYVNPAFCQITGYTTQEVLGRTPRLLSSGLHDRHFYQQMWDQLLATGNWQGEITNRGKQGQLFTEWISISRVRDSQGQPTHYVSVFSDISQIKESEQKLRHLAYYDPLTDLPNRAKLLEQVGHAIEVAQRRDEHVVMMFIDLDDFKAVNDSLGHAVGDELLKLVGKRFRERLRQTDILARFGGDEFGVLLEDCRTREDAARVAQHLIDALQEPFLLHGQRAVVVGASLGIAVYPDDAGDAGGLLRCADTAAYQAKRRGRNGFVYYTEDLTHAAMQRLELENELKRALADDEFRVYYQPVFDVGSGRLTGAEALVRWEHPERGLVSPGTFIPVAEQTGLIVPLGEWVLRAVMRQIETWQAEGADPGVIAVNVSAQQLRRGDFPAVFARCLENVAITPDAVELELTESGLLDEGGTVIQQMQSLKEQGVKLAIDDFGTGYSSLSYLKRFPVDKLKIDRSFVRDLESNESDREIAHAIIAVAKALGLKVQAEGVETDGQLALLRNLQCDTYQGFYASAPVSAEAFEHFLNVGCDSRPRQD